MQKNKLIKPESHPPDLAVPHLHPFMSKQEIHDALVVQDATRCCGSDAQIRRRHAPSGHIGDERRPVNPRRYRK